MNLKVENKKKKIGFKKVEWRRYKYTFYGG